jgi:hypothetical protein
VAQVSFPYAGRALQRGWQGQEVKILQQRLLSLGFSPLKVDGDYGPRTESVVKLYQSRNGLDADGITGKQTWTSVFSLPKIRNGTPPTRLAAGAVEIARTQKDVREIGGNNLGPQVEAYQRSTGNKPGSAYCMSLMYFCYDEAAKLLSVPNPLVKTGGVLDHWNRAHSGVKVTVDMVLDDISLIQPGALFIIDHGDDRGHTGMVIVASSDGLETFEGNTNVRGSRDGQGNYYRKRSFSEINVGYLDYSRTT